MTRITAGDPVTWVSRHTDTAEHHAFITRVRTFGDQLLLFRFDSQIKGTEGGRCFSDPLGVHLNCGKYSIAFGHISLGQHVPHDHLLRVEGDIIMNPENLMEIRAQVIVRELAGIAKCTVRVMDRGVVVVDVVAAGGNTFAASLQPSQSNGVDPLYAFSPTEEDTWGDHYPHNQRYANFKEFLGAAVLAVEQANAAAAEAAFADKPPLRFGNDDPTPMGAAPVDGDTEVAYAYLITDDAGNHAEGPFASEAAAIQEGLKRGAPFLMNKVMRTDVETLFPTEEDFVTAFRDMMARRLTEVLRRSNPEQPDIRGSEVWRTIDESTLSKRHVMRQTLVTNMEFVTVSTKRVRIVIE